MPRQSDSLDRSRENMRHLLLSSLLVAIQTHASHLRGSELRYTWISGTTYAFELVEYIDQNGPQGQPLAIVDNGDGTPLDTVSRDSIVLNVGDGCGMLRKDSYGWQHTYAGPGNYTVQCEIANRYAGIVNIPNANSEGHCAQALVVVLSGSSGNNSPIFQNLQTEVDWIGNTLVHTPQPGEPDQDSLVFELVQQIGRASCRERVWR